MNVWLLQVQLMEQQLAAMNWKPGELETRIHELQALLQERDLALRDLDMQLEEQVSSRVGEQVISWDRPTQRGEGGGGGA